MREVGHLRCGSVSGFLALVRAIPHGWPSVQGVSGYRPLWDASGRRRPCLRSTSGCLSPVRVRFHPPLCGTSVTFGAGAYPNICAGWFPSFSVCGISGCGLVCEALPSTCLLCEVFPCALLVCEAFADLLCGAFRQPPAECRLIPSDLLFRDGAGRSGRYTGVYLFQ